MPTHMGPGEVRGEASCQAAGAPRHPLRLLVAAALWAMGSIAALPAEVGSSHVAPPIPGVKAIDVSGLHNVFVLGTNVISGSSPEGEAAFAALQRLGVKTILTVDGGKPDVEGAGRHGIRYVHLPHGYDGIPTNLQLLLAKAGASLPGPIYVHCHHGLHRGPAAAAVICMANNGWTPTQAEAWLLAAGTATNYTGLYEVVRKFRPPTAEQLRAVPAEFPETAKVSGLVDAMVKIDERWAHLKAVRAAGYRTPPGHPDIVPANEAVTLWEYYREAQRLPDAVRHGTSFIDRLKSAEVGAREAERLLRLYAGGETSEVRVQLDRMFDAMAASCRSCHKAHRDAAGIKTRP